MSKAGGQGGKKIERAIDRKRRYGKNARDSEEEGHSLEEINRHGVAW